LIGTVKRTIFKKVRTETVLKLYNTLILPTFLHGSENWNLTASQRRRTAAAEMKLLRPLAGYTLWKATPFRLLAGYTLYTSGRLQPLGLWQATSFRPLAG
jgi:hypothetical protein